MPYEYCDCLMESEMEKEHKQNPGFCPFCGKRIHEWKLETDYCGGVWASCKTHGCFMDEEALQQILDHEKTIKVEIRNGTVG